MQELGKLELEAVIVKFSFFLGGEGPPGRFKKCSLQLLYILLNENGPILDRNILMFR
jgi:hypothetical protein